jgi:hypothetical protein
VRSKGKILLSEIKGKIIDNAVYFLLCLNIQLGTV